jgi:hypothetical protein
MRQFVALLLAAVIALAPRPAAADEAVDLALVLVADVSRSIDDYEYDLQKRGYEAALSDPRVIAAIRGGAIGRIALNYLEFASSFEVKTVVGWTIIHDAASAQAFAASVRAAPRSFYGRTSISAGVELAMKNLASSGLEATRRVIDVSGDGVNNNGRHMPDVRDEAVEAGITINGLAIINDRPQPWAMGGQFIPGGLDGYYRDSVVGGPGAFVIVVEDFPSFGEAMTRKLITEISGLALPPRKLAGP